MFFHFIFILSLSVCLIYVLKKNSIRRMKEKGEFCNEFKEKGIKDFVIERGDDTLSEL